MKNKTCFEDLRKCGKFVKKILPEIYIYKLETKYERSQTRNFIWVYLEIEFVGPRRYRGYGERNCWIRRNPKPSAGRSVVTYLCLVGPETGCPLLCAGEVFVGNSADCGDNSASFIWSDFAPSPSLISCITAALVFGGRSVDDSLSMMTLLP